jgi:hypothetical protein
LVERYFYFHSETFKVPIFLEKKGHNSWTVNVNFTIIEKRKWLQVIWFKLIWQAIKSLLHCQYTRICKFLMAMKWISCKINHNMFHSFHCLIQNLECRGICDHQKHLFKFEKIWLSVTFIFIQKPLQSPPSKRKRAIIHER